MGEVINLRRVRKAKARAVSTAQADANRAKHGKPKRERDLAKARTEKVVRTVDAHKLGNKE